MLSRFKACLVGAVVGDCVGSNYEGMCSIKITDVVNTVLQLEELFSSTQQAQRKEEARPLPKYHYTDDTAMARSVAASLLEKKHFDARDMANRFSTEYFKEPDRGYGGSVVTVFESLRDPGLIDVFRPASMQFGGRGSYGNGGAMRIAPAALFAFHENDLLKLKDLVSSITRITHTHHLAINGALLQAFAVDQSLRQQQETIDADEFIDSLISKMRPIEEESSAGNPPADNKRESAKQIDGHPTPYCYKLSKMKELLKNRDLIVEDVANELGNDVSAIESVPTAVFAFLKAATQNIPELTGRNKFEQTVLYAISVGGDTDTIATMAASIAGALYGIEQIPDAWQCYCEGVNDAERAAEEMFKVVTYFRSLAEMLSRFKACLVGAVVGDCVGSNYEGMCSIKITDVVNTVLQLEELFSSTQQAQRKEEAKPLPKYYYTDDTAMARSVTASLLEKKHFDARDMANRFSTEYFKEPDRGYGQSVVTIFERLRDPGLIDVFRPASMQFGGRGSYGNGGAMRIAPAALFAFHENDLLKLKDLVSSITRITHTHHLAINGALLQAFAVDQSLRQQQENIDADEFIDSLISKMRPIEEESSAGNPPAANKRESAKQIDGHPTPYCYKLSKMKELLKNRDLIVEDVADELGNDVSAIESVPTAVFAFLKAATQNIPELTGRNKFEQTVLYAISVGGDTDTIATMAAAIAGALYGIGQIPDAWQCYCEGVNDAERAAEEMFKIGSLTHV